MNNDGYFKLIIGPMYARKSTELVRCIDQYKYLKKKIMVINHVFNNRYNSTNLTTHSGYEYDNCITLKDLSSIESEHNTEFQEAEVIIVDELQFFEDAIDIIPDWCDKYKKHVVASGLSGNFERKPIGQVLDLIPHADEVIHLKAFCSKCGDGTPAIFSKKIVNNSDNILVGSTESYMAVCRKHYLENN